jgi:hypothetical protein
MKVFFKVSIVRIEGKKLAKITKFLYLVSQSIAINIKG